MNSYKIKELGYFWSSVCPNYKFATIIGFQNLKGAKSDSLIEQFKGGRKEFKGGDHTKNYELDWFVHI